MGISAPMPKFTGQSREMIQTISQFCLKYAKMLL